jgi:hypothetical protein
MFQYMKISTSVVKCARVRRDSDVQPRWAGREIWERFWHGDTHAVRDGFAKSWVYQSKKSNLSLLDRLALRVAKMSNNISM